LKLKKALSEPMTLTRFFHSYLHKFYRQVGLARMRSTKIPGEAGALGRGGPIRARTWAWRGRRVGQRKRWRQLRPGLPERQTHDYERHGTTTLFAALNVLDGTVIGHCQQRHRHQEFLRFLDHLEASVEPASEVHIIMDNCGTHKHPAVKNWFAAHPPLPGTLHAKRIILAAAVPSSA
jgi:DDE superfamily endonuclease